MERQRLQTAAAEPAGAEDDGLVAIEVSPALMEPLVGECVDAQHPTLAERVLVRWSSTATTERWVSVLQGLAVRVGDRVLLMKPANWSEPIVVGVIDGFAKRPEPRRTTAVQIALLPDESLQVTGADGTPLVEVFASHAGPVVRLAQRDVTIELPGALRLSARSIELHARDGGARVSANGDVELRGETVHLN
jgi:hypothetical protein